MILKGGRSPPFVLRRGFLGSDPNPDGPLFTSFQRAIEDLKPAEQKFDPVRSKSPIVFWVAMDFEMHDRCQNDQTIRSEELRWISSIAF